MRKKIIIILLIIITVIIMGIISYQLYKKYRHDNTYATIEITVDENEPVSKKYHAGDFLDIPIGNIWVEDIMLAGNTKSIDSVVLKSNKNIFNSKNGYMEIIPIRQATTISYSGKKLKIRVVDIMSYDIVDNEKETISTEDVTPEYKVTVKITAVAALTDAEGGSSYSYIGKIITVDSEEEDLTGKEVKFSSKKLYETDTDLKGTYQNGKFTLSE